MSKQPDSKPNERSSGTVEINHQLWNSFHEIAQTILSSFDLNRILDDMSRRIVEAGILRSVMIALVNHDKHEVEVVRSLRLFPDNEHLRFDPDLKPGELGKYLEKEDSVMGFRYDLDDENITAVVAKTGELQIIDSQEDTRLDRRFDDDATDWKHQGKIAYFIPVKHGNRVVAVVATGSRAREKEQTLERIDLMEPLLDLFAIALHNASLYKELHETNEAPGMPGDQLVAHMSKLDPTLATILITGWNLDKDGDRLAPFDYFLQKPFTDLGFLHQTVNDAKALHAQRASSKD